MSSYFESLPLELLEHMFSFAELEDLQNLKHTSIKLRKAVSSFEKRVLYKAFNSRSRVLENGATALIIAVKLDLTKLSIDLINNLTKSAADETYINWFDNHNKTALHYAIENSNIKIVLKLLENGAINILPGKDLDTPLILAAKLNNFAAASALLNKNINYMHHPKHSYPPINIAAASGNYKMVDYLYQMGARKNFITYLNMGAGILNLIGKIYDQFTSILCRPRYS